MIAWATIDRNESRSPATDGGRPKHVAHVTSRAPAAGGLEAAPNLTSPPQPCSVVKGGGATLLPRPDPAMTSAPSSSDQGGQPARDARPGGAAGGRHEAASWPPARPDGAVLGVVGGGGAGPRWAGAVRFVQLRSAEGRRYAGYVLLADADQDALTTRLRVEQALWEGRA